MSYSIRQCPECLLWFGLSLFHSSADNCRQCRRDYYRARYASRLDVRKKCLVKKSTEYNTWRSIRKRCHDPRDKAYRNYGWRGIKVCNRWMKFENFLKDMGPKPFPDYTIERMDNDGNYEPSNCKWATRLEQGQNRRNVTPLTINGRTKTMRQWMKQTGITVAHHRLKGGWSPERTFSTPMIRKKTKPIVLKV